jgi:hypothetical protein
MPRAEAKEGSMAKVSKSLYLNDQLSQVVDAVSESTGATFTKIVTASLIQYLFGDLEPPSPSWMRLAMALERGDSTVPEIVLRIAEKRADDAVRAVEQTLVAKCLIEQGYSGSRRDTLEKLIAASKPPLAAVIKELTERPSGKE